MLSTASCTVGTDIDVDTYGSLRLFQVSAEDVLANARWNLRRIAISFSELFLKSSMSSQGT